MAYYLGGGIIRELIDSSANRRYPTSFQFGPLPAAQYCSS